MADGGYFGKGQVINCSNGTVLCFIMSGKEPEIYKLGPGRKSAFNVDVDGVKADRPGTMYLGSGRGFPLWFRIHDNQKAEVRGRFPDLQVDINLSFMSSTQTDEVILAAMGVKGPIEKYMKPDQFWGENVN